MRVQHVGDGGWAKLFWPAGDDRTIDKFAASIGGEVDRNYRIWEKPIPAKGA